MTGTRRKAVVDPSRGETGVEELVKDGPFASRERAVEIALMDGDCIGLAEFTELTGKGAPGWGVYRISAEGISVGPMSSLGDLTPVAQHEFHTAARILSLRFRCTADAFMRWYDATRGKNGVSDFPLAEGFAEELRQHEGSVSSSAGPSVPSRDIASAFKVKAHANVTWWRTRLRHPSRYRLHKARAALGAAQRPSRWYPAIVAGWLIDRGYLDRGAVLRAMRDNFPSHDVDHLG